jgi:hypothetical protein
MIAPHPHERPLRAALIISSTLFWAGLALLLWTLWERFDVALSLADIVLLVGVLGIVTYLAVNLRRIGRAARLLGYAVEVGPEQYPDLHARVHACAKRLGLPEPLAFLFQSPRDLRSFSLRYRGRDYLALNGEWVGALTDHQGAIDFFIGYELARLHDMDRYFSWLILPGRVLPVLGPAYARAKIYTGDRHGIAACRVRVDAALALATLASGSRRWKSFSISHYAEQALRGDIAFTFSELISSTPFLTRRIAHLRGVATGEGGRTRRHPVAWLGAALVPGVGPRDKGMIARLLVAVIWPLVVATAVLHGYRQLANAGWVEPLPSRFENKVVQLPTPTATVTPTPAPSEMPADLYYRLDGDLKRLGQLALNRHRKLGSIPCEVGNIAVLNLYFQASRFAFSCDEPVVYTVVEPGEFEPGRSAHLRTYNWKEGRFSNSLPSGAVPVEPKAAPLTTP